MAAMSIRFPCSASVPSSLAIFRSRPRTSATNPAGKVRNALDAHYQVDQPQHGCLAGRRVPIQAPSQELEDLEGVLGGQEAGAQSQRGGSGLGDLCSRGLGLARAAA